MLTDSICTGVANIHVVGYEDLKNWFAFHEYPTPSMYCIVHYNVALPQYYYWHGRVDSQWEGWEGWFISALFNHYVIIDLKHLAVQLFYGTTKLVGT